MKLGKGDCMKIQSVNSVPFGLGVQNKKSPNNEAILDVKRHDLKPINFEMARALEV